MRFLALPIVASVWCANFGTSHAFQSLQKNNGACYPQNATVFLGRELNTCMVAGLTSFALKNRGNVEVSFAVRVGTENWRTLKLSAGEADAVLCLGCAAVQFSIATVGGKLVEYQLYVGKRYAIYWKEADSMWDVVEMTD